MNIHSFMFVLTSYIKIQSSPQIISKFKPQHRFEPNLNPPHPEISPQYLLSQQQAQQELNKMTIIISNLPLICCERCLKNSYVHIFSIILFPSRNSLRAEKHFREIYQHFLSFRAITSNLCDFSIFVSHLKLSP